LKLLLLFLLELILNEESSILKELGFYYTGAKSGGISNLNALFFLL